MYEVDGVFRDGPPDKPMSYEERTQNIRLMFLAPTTSELKQR